VSAGFRGGAAIDEQDGFRIRRVGTRWTVYWHAWRLYRQELAGRYDFVVDEINAMPFFCRLYVKEPNVVLIHQLTREVWFYQISQWIGWLGYLLEPAYLALLAPARTVTVSESTAAGLRRYGFGRRRPIHIISEGTRMPLLPELDDRLKAVRPTWLVLGGIRPMKRTMQALRAFEIARAGRPDLRLVIAGGPADRYGREVERAARESAFAADIAWEGAVSDERKIELMTAAHLLLVTSVREGWGIIVTEANRRGTPVAAYDVPGLRDSVRDRVTGRLSPAGDIPALARTALDLTFDRDQYRRLQRAAWEWSQSITFDRSADDFMAAVNAELDLCRRR
jgi:glycosyltransferase involved in cell wall biosynthesis